MHCKGTDAFADFYYTYTPDGNQTRKTWRRTETDKHVRGSIGFVKVPHADGQNCLDIRTYNAHNQLVQAQRDAQSIAYTYRPDGLRHSKTVTKATGTKATTTHIWNGGNLVAELNGSTIKARYLRGAGLVCQQVDSSSFYYLHNGHGDVVRRIDHSGNLQKPYDYDAFGNLRLVIHPGMLPTDGLDTDPNPFRYCGEYWDSDIGEVYLRARTYDPATGRWTAEDEVRDGLNWYAYCYNNPMFFVDPSGNIPIWAEYAIGIAIIAGLVVAAVCTGSYVLASAAVGAGIGAVVGGGFSAGVAELAGKDSAEAGANGFMWGAIGGAAYGAIGGSTMGVGQIVLLNSATAVSLYTAESIVNDQTPTGAGYAAAIGSSLLGVGPGLQNAANTNTNTWVNGLGFLTPEQAINRSLKRSIISNVGWSTLGEGMEFGASFLPDAPNIPLSSWPDSLAPELPTMSGLQSWFSQPNIALPAESGQINPTTGTDSRIRGSNGGGPSASRTAYFRDVQEARAQISAIQRGGVKITTTLSNGTKIRAVT